MKNVIIYNQIASKSGGSGRWDDEGLIRYLKAQVENSIRLGWNLEDIVVGTNFPFNHLGITSFNLEEICDWSGFNNFWFGAYELLKKGFIEDDFWLHDHDSWQISPMEFPLFDGVIGGCEYVGTREWNCGAVYFNKKNSLEILEYIVDFLKKNKDYPVSSDEVFIAILRRNSPISKYMTSINSRWNVGLTHGNLRLKEAKKPVIVFSFKPDQLDIFKKIENLGMSDLIDKDFYSVIKNNFYL